MRRDDTLKHWWTLSERSHDKRTGATAMVTESVGGLWKWGVQHSSGQKLGESTTQKGARAAARRYVRKLPSAPSKPDEKPKQLSIYDAIR